MKSEECIIAAPVGIEELPSQVVLPTGLGDLPAGLVWTGKTVQFGSGTVQNTDPLLRGCPNPAPYPSTRRIHWV